MRVTLRRLTDGELDGELIAFVLLAAGGAFIALWLLSGLPTPVCTFHALTGVPCLTCGGTRCLRCLLVGHPAAALGWNPLVFFTTGAAAIFGLYAAIVLAFRLPRIRLAPLTPAEARAWRIGLALIAAANWIYLVFRFSRGG